LASTHHQTSVLPAVTMQEFVRQGGEYADQQSLSRFKTTETFTDGPAPPSPGVLKGREERFDFFEGEPRSVGGNVTGQTDKPATGGAADERRMASIAPQRDVVSQSQPATRSE